MPGAVGGLNPWQRQILFFSEPGGWWGTAQGVWFPKVGLVDARAGKDAGGPTGVQEACLTARGSIALYVGGPSERVGLNPTPAIVLVVPAEKLTAWREKSCQAVDV